MPDQSLKQIAAFVRERRRARGLTQQELAETAGVGLRFIRDLEQETKALRSDKINQVLSLFGHTLGALPLKTGEASLTSSGDANAK